MKLVLRLGGSVIASPINPDLIKKYSKVIQILKNQNHEFVVIVGGGKLARKFIMIAKKLGLEERAQDEIAISVSRVYAQLILKTIKQIKYNKIALTLKDVIYNFNKEKFVVMGGLKPGMTTDSVAALVAKQIHANLIVKCTNQNGVYNKDPKIYPNAVKIDTLAFEDLPKILQENNHKAGIHQIVDPEAIKILRNENIKLIIVNGFDPNNIISAVNGEKIGTQIS